MNLSEIQDQLKKQLEQHQLSVKKLDGKSIHLENDYVIEVENEHLFKLLQGGYVVAPFDDIAELCEFIKMDMGRHT